MFMSEDTAKKLDLDFVLDMVTVYTPYGKDLKKSMRPFTRDEKAGLMKELDRIAKIVELIEKQRYTFVEMRNYFKHMKDLRLTFKRVREESILSTTELFEIKLFVSVLNKLSISLNKLKWDIPDDLNITSISYLEELFDPQKTGTNTFYIYDEYSENLSRIRKEIREVDAEISKERKKVKNQVEKDLNIKLRPNGEITINKTNSELIEKFRHYELLAYGVETYMNITFKIKSTSRIDKLSSKLEGLRSLEEEEEYKVRQYLSREINKYIEIIDKNIEAIARLDLLIAKGYHAIGFKAVRPEITDESRIYIQEGRHIKVEQRLRQEGREFTPITLDLNKGVTCITGANMGGKTVALRLIGMLSAMAQYGMFVPAERMIFSLKDFIFFSMGDMQSTDMGLSTFGGEIVKIKEAIKRSDKKGLILIDELARGTNPKEGYAISKAIINYLREKETITVITTHFDGLADDQKVKHLQVMGLSIEDFEQVSQPLHYYMDYRLREIKDVKEVPKDAIKISRLMGLDEEILKNAEEILKEGYR